MGHGDSIALLGIMHLDAMGLPANPKEAVRLFQLAAQQGSAFGNYMMAQSYVKGRGTALARNPVQAVPWYTRAAELGLAEAAFELACLYQRPQPPGCDLVAAFRWLRQAADMGDEQAQSVLDAHRAAGDGR